MIRRTLIILTLSILSIASWAQSFSKSLLFQDDLALDVIHQSHFQDSSQWLIYMPSFNYHASQKGPKITDYIFRDEQNRLLIDPSRALQNAEEDNVVQSGGRVNVLSVAWRNENFIVSGGYGLRYIAHVDYPLQALSLYTAGNALIFGEQLDLSFDAQVQAIHSYHLGLNYQVGKLTIGGRIEYLSGITDLSVSRNQLNIEVAPLFYGISINNDFQLNTTQLLDYRDINEIIVDYTGDLGSSFLSANSGIALSLGLDYAVDDKSSVKLRVSDIGSISWSEAPENYVTVGQSSFGGVNILDLINVQNRVSYQDSLEALLDVIETNDSYDTTLPISLSASYSRMINSDIDMTIAGNMVTLYDRLNYSLGIAGRYHVLNNASVSASISHSPFQSLSVGLGARMCIGPVELYAVTQNITALFNQLDAHFNASSIGVNLQF